MSEPTGSDAHPAFNRILESSDLNACPVGFQVVDQYGIVWTYTKGHQGWSAWTSSVETVPGVTASQLIPLCGPIRRYQP